MWLNLQQLLNNSNKQKEDKPMGESKDVLEQDRSVNSVASKAGQKKAEARLSKRKKATKVVKKVKK